MKIRVVKTASGASAVQVVQYKHNKRIIVQHIGSSHTPEGIDELKFMATEWIKDHSAQLSLFSDENPNKLLHLNHCSFLGVRYSFFYKEINKILSAIGLEELAPLLKDLITIRIFEPASKLRSLELIERYFGIHHNRKTYYKMAADWLNTKEFVETQVVNFAKKTYSFDYDLLFYDVTTLYFETFTEDELRKNGFSKDNKSNQPQILIALMVSKEGFPITYEIFSGNTFEGHTIIPVVKKFIDKHQIKNFTIVADAAMISADNIKLLREYKINYIVGARMGNLSANLFKTIDENICREDGKSIRLKTDNGYLVCSYSSVRYRKDLYEMNKQIDKAKQVVENPSKNKKLKFVQSKDKQIVLNDKLIEKTRKLLGIKGYYTDLEESITSNNTIIERYHELYKIEQAFRISKSDLQTRPIFHFKEEPIKLHILICFVALVVSKHIELKAGISIKKFVDEAKKMVDGQILNQITNKMVLIQAEPTNKMREILQRIFSPH